MNLAIILFLLIGIIFNGFSNLYTGSTPPKPQNEMGGIEDTTLVINAIDNTTFRSTPCRNGWKNSFDNDSYVEHQENINISNSNVKLNSTDLFLITTTADFDAGEKYYVETYSDNPSIPEGELHIVANDTIFTEDFEGIDEQDLDVYDPNWVVIKEPTSTTASAKIDTGRQVTGSSSVRFNATNAFNRLRAERNIGTYTTLSAYIRAEGPSNPFLYHRALNQDIIISDLQFYGAFNLFYYDGGNKLDTGYDYSFNTWYKVKTVLDFTNQQYDVYIDGGAFSDLLIVDNASFRNPETSANTVRIGNGDAWSEPVNPESYGWYDNLIADKFQASAIWESAAQSIQNYEQLMNTTITYSGLASGASEINKIEWLVNNVVKATYETDIENNALSPFTIFEDDLTSGSFADIDSDFTIKIYLTSDGIKTPRIEQLEGSAIYKNGTLISTPITIPTNNVWDVLTINKTEPSDTSINISVLNSTTNQVITGFSKLTGALIDLSAINPVDNTIIKFRANFSTEGLNSPLLHDWSVNWKPDPPKLTSDIPSGWAFLEDTDADNLINLGNYFEDVWTPDDKLLFEIIYESDDTHIDASVDGKFLNFTTPTINWSGYETFQVRCTDEGGLFRQSNDFKVTVIEVNDAPAWSPIDDIDIDEDSTRTEIVELDDYIYDCDDIIANISYNLISNNNPTNILIEIHDRMVWAEPLTEDYVGNAIIKLNANDGFAGSNTSFYIIINPVNDPPTVELLSPLNNSIITTSTVKLTWSEGFDVDSTIESYDVYLDDLSPPQTLISNDQTVTSFNMDLEDGTYHWTVIPYDGIDEGVWNTNKIWTFTVSIYVEPPIPPPAITLSSPYNSTKINTTTVELSWNGNESYTDLKYFVYFDTESTTNKIIASEITDTKITITDLEDGVTYYWTIIPISGPLMGVCIDGIWSFTVQLDFIPYYKVDIMGIERLKMNQSDQEYCNLTVTNEGNIRDIYIPELDAGIIDNYVKFINIGNIILDPNNSSQLQLLITLPENSPPGEFNITVVVNSFWGGQSINDTHKINVKIAPKAIEESSSSTTREKWTDFIVWIALIIAIILILIAIALIAQRRKRKLEDALAAEGIAKPGEESPVLLPDIISQPGEIPQLGATGSGTALAAGAIRPVLKSAVSPAVIQAPTPQLAQHPSAPQLLPPAEPGVVTTPPNSENELPESAAPSTSDTAPMVTPVQGQVTDSGVISKEEQINLLEEQLLRNEIDLNTYKELRTKYESESNVQIPEVQRELPPTHPSQPDIPQDVPPHQSASPQPIVPIIATPQEPQEVCPKCNSKMNVQADGSTFCNNCGHK